MTKLEKLYSIIENSKAVGVKLGKDVLQQVETLEEGIIKEEILPALSDDIAPRLEPIKRDLVLVVEYHPGKPISVALSRKAKISEIVGTKLMQPDSPAEFHDEEEYPLVKKAESAGCVIYHDYKIIDGKCIIPPGTTIIKKQAFSNCKSLKYIVIPESVTEIGSYAFYGCVNLANVVIPHSVKVLCAKAFYDCVGLKTVELPSTITSIRNQLFYRCSNLSSIDIPLSVKKIGKKAFLGCKSMTSVKIPSSVTEIAEGAFAGCSGLTRLEIPLSVTSIERNAFAQCNNLKEVAIPKEFSSRIDEIFSNPRKLTIKYI